MLILLHGFLGAKEDWNEVISYLPGIPCCALSYPFVMPKEGILVGYSMGGRIASSYPHPKILISTHLGLATQKERQERRAWENRWLTVLKNQPFETFLELWYAQPLFSSLKKSTHFAALFARRLKSNRLNALEQFENHLLSEQTPLIPGNACFVCGTEDLKYVNLYNEFCLTPLLVERSSHACHLEQPRNCARAILDGMRRLSRYPVSQRG